MGTLIERKSNLKNHPNSCKYFPNYEFNVLSFFKVFAKICSTINDLDPPKKKFAKTQNQKLKLESPKINLLETNSWFAHHNFWPKPQF